MNKIVITIEGGCVVGVRVKNKNVRVFVRDVDGEQVGEKTKTCEFPFVQKLHPNTLRMLNRL